MSAQAMFLFRVDLKPETRKTDAGKTIRIRKAEREDRAQLDKLHQPGEHRDLMVDNFFVPWVNDPETVVLLAESGPDVLGIAVVAFPCLREACVYSLNVSPTARRQGVARELLGACNRLATQVCGPSSICRWVVRSSDEVMVNWSEQLCLNGPVKLANFQVSKPDQTVGIPLPDGWAWRDPKKEDIKLLLDHRNGEAGAFMSFGDDPALRVNWGRSGAISQLDGPTLQKFMQGKAMYEDDEFEQDLEFAPLIYDSEGQLAAFAPVVTGKVAPEKAGSVSMSCPWLSGTKEGLKVMLDHLKAMASAKGVDVWHICIPDVEWFAEELGAAGFSRCSPDNDLVYSWTPADYVMP